jgi:hypothetical protein
MEPAKRIAACSAWDHLLEEIISLIAIKVVETSEAPLEDLHSLRLCNKTTKRASSSRAIANRFNLEHHNQSTIWRDTDTLNAYLQTIDWLQGANNRGALFIKGMGGICTCCPGATALLTWEEEEGDLQAAYVLAILKYYKHGATDNVFNHIWYIYEEEGDLQAAYVLAILKYYKHGATDNVFNHIWCIYGEVTFGSQVGGRWWMEDGDYDEDDAHVAWVHHWVSAEIGRVMWREHIIHDHVHELHVLDACVL